jgi:Zn finger protein HypA/HybF involved in hydrogenase expression
MSVATLAGHDLAELHPEHWCRQCWHTLAELHPDHWCRACGAELAELHPDYVPRGRRTR